MRWFRLISLRLQIILLVLSFTLAVGLGNTYRAHLALDDLAREQFERRSLATALALAAQVTDLSFSNDLFGLYELLNHSLVNTPDVRYIMVLDDTGAIRAHTFGPGVPRGLVEANTAAPGEAWHINRLSTEEGPVVDVAIPLTEGQPGLLRLGMSEQVIIDSVNRHTWQLVGLMTLSLLPVLAVTYILGRALTTPLLKLVEGTNAIRRGELARPVSVTGRDEVAQLGAAFNEMTHALARSQAALEDSNQTLQTRNEELAALYTVATAMAQADTVDGLAQAALTKALEVMGLTVGWVFLTPDPPGSAPCLRAVAGLPPESAGQLPVHRPDCCVPDALQQAQITHAGQPCPCFGPNQPHQPELCHAVVPLNGRTQNWGSMHLACSNPDCFSSTHLNLLTAIGRQVGMAVENSYLAEAQRRESFRRLLLDRVLVAQEEERKRIARELHDELAQSLAVLIRDLEEASRPEAPGQQSLPARSRDTRALALRILEQTRRLIFDLRPSALDDLGLLPALRRFAQHHLDLAGIELHVTVSGTKRRLPPEMETALFRIAQEAISNVVKHAQASQVQLNLWFDAQRVTLTITDNGLGFTPEEGLNATQDGAGCLGLLGMRERAELLGGDLEINSRPGHGASVRVTIPLEAST